MQLNLNDISYTYPQAAEPVLDGVSATFPAGWTGIVGDNGCGKTTLARIAGGLLTPDGGTVTPRLFCAFCEQDPTLEPPALADFAMAWDERAVRLRRDLAIGDGWEWRFGELSCGQQKRLQLACALWADPDVLVVDEPTNHVDAETRAALAAPLEDFRGIGLLISHDRALLDRICGQCLFMGGGRAVMRPGGYSQGAEQAALERKTATTRRENARRQARKLEEEAQRRRQEAAKAAAKRSCRGLDRHDSDGRGRVKLAIYTGKDGVAGKLSGRMDARASRARQEADAITVEKRYDADIWMDARPSARKVLCRLAAGVVPFGGGRTEGAGMEGARNASRETSPAPGSVPASAGGCADVGATTPAPPGGAAGARGATIPAPVGVAIPELYVGNADHIALTGRNGAGKTTLVRAVMAALPPDIPRAYLPQEPSPAQQRQALERLATLDAASRGRALGVVARLNSDPDRILEGSRTSPGEMRKLMLALDILDAPALIVMDEPTNHLDLHSVEALEQLLGAYPGALLLVSHDAQLLDRATTIRWRLEPAGQGSRLVAQG